VTVLRVGVILCACALMAACGTPASGPRGAVGAAAVAAIGLPRSAQVAVRDAAGAQQQRMLVVQALDGGATRWSMFDTLGVPRARQILRDGHWRNDGLMPPAADISRMFAVVLFAWTPGSMLGRAYPRQRWIDQRAADGRLLRKLVGGALDGCHIEFAAQRDTFSLGCRRGGAWRVAPLDTATALPVAAPGGPPSAPRPGSALVPTPAPDWPRPASSAGGNPP
jgi:hypothetical protein